MKFLSNIIFLFSIVFSNEQSFFDGFETGDLQQLDWFTQGDVSWVVDNQDSYGGDYSVQVDAIDHNQISTLTLNVDAGCRGDSQIQFYLKIDTEEYRDILHFYINGEEQYCSGQNDCGWSGNQDWQLFTFDIPQGQSNLKWEYEKDCCGDTNDFVAIDNVEFTAYLPIPHISDENGDGLIGVEFVHDHIPGGVFQLDGSTTESDFDSSIYTWSLLDSSFLADGQEPSIFFNCLSEYDQEQDSWDCIANYEIELAVTCGNYAGYDTISLSILEPNNPPVAALTTILDSMVIYNPPLGQTGWGIPGDSTYVVPGQYVDFPNVIDPDGIEIMNYPWNFEDEEIQGFIKLPEGNYVLDFHAVDNYGAYGSAQLNLVINEENDIPIVDIAVQDIDNTEQDFFQVPENEAVLLYGIVIDESNDVDGTETPDIEEDDINYFWTCSITNNETDFLVYDQYSQNTSFIAPSVEQGETKEIICFLEVSDPFQEQGYESSSSSISDPITLEIININVAPILSEIEGSYYTIMEDDTSDVISVEMLETNGFIEIIDIDFIEFSLFMYDDTSETNNYSIDEYRIIPDEDFFGNIAIPIQVDDGQTTSDGNSFNSLSDTLNLIVEILAVNDSPYFISLDTLTVEEGQSAIINSIQVMDVESYTDNIKFEVLLNYGSLELAPSGTIYWEECDGNDGTNPAEYDCGSNPIESNAIFNTYISNFNNAMNGAIYHSDEDNEDNNNGELIIKVDDLGNIGGDNLVAQTNIMIVTSAVNDAPSITLPTISDNDIFEDEEFIFNNIELFDVDVGENAMHLIIDPENGYISVTPGFDESQNDNLDFIGCDGILDSYLHIVGSITDLQLAVTQLSFISNYNYSGIASINFVLNDQGATGSGEEGVYEQILIFYINQVNDAPQISYPAIDFYEGNEDEELHLLGISVNDLDVNDAENEDGNPILGSLEVTLKCNECKLAFETIENLDFIEGTNNSSSMVFSGNINEINSSFSELIYITDNSFNGDDEIFIKVNDLGNYASNNLNIEMLDSVNIPIIISPINDPPVNESSAGNIVSPPFISEVQSDIGLALHVTEGNWNDDLDNMYLDNVTSPSEISYSFQWQRADDTLGTNVADIAGEINQDYLLSIDDSDKYIRVEVTAIDNGIGEPESQSTIAYSIYSEDLWYHLTNLPPQTNTDNNNDSYSIDEDTILIADDVSILDNDLDPDGEQLTSILIQGPQFGTLIEPLLSTGHFVYEPEDDANGTDYFTYKACDEAGFCSNETTVYIDVHSINDTPSFSFENNVYSGINEGLVEGYEWADDIFCGDPGVEQGLSFHITNIQDSSLFTQDGMPIISEEGLLSFESAADSSGISLISVYLQDDGTSYDSNAGVVSDPQASDTVSFSISIMAQNNPPSFILPDTLIQIMEDEGNGSYMFENLFAINIEDGDSLGQSLEFIIDSNSNEVLFDTLFIAITGNEGTLTYQIKENMSGSALIGLVLQDFANGLYPEYNTSEPQEFTIDVISINDYPHYQLPDTEVPVFEDDNNGFHSIDSWAINIDDGDPEIAQALTFEISNYNPVLYDVPPAISPSGTLTFTTAENMFGVDDSIMIKLVDEGTFNNSDLLDYSFKITIDGVNDPPAFAFNGSSNIILLEDQFGEDQDGNSLPVSLGVILGDAPFGENDEEITWSINPENALYNQYEFADISINSSTGLVTIYEISNGNGLLEFTVTAIDNGDTLNNGINYFSDSFSLLIDPLNDPPQLADENNIPYIIDNNYFVGDTLHLFNSISLWSDTLDANFGGESNIVEFKYQWVRASDYSYDDLELINIVPSNDSTYVITTDDAHQFIGANIIVIDDGIGITTGNNNQFIYSTGFIEVLNSNPTANSHNYNLYEDADPGFEVNPPGIILNAVDFDGDGLTAHLLSGSNVNFGDLDLRNDGSFLYVPDLDYYGSDSFVYYVEDEQGSQSNPAIVTLNIQPINDPPEFSINSLDGSIIGDTIIYLEDFIDIDEILCVINDELVPYNEIDQEVTFSISPGNEEVDLLGIYLDDQSGEIFIGSNPEQFGIQEFIITAEDDGGEMLGGIARFERKLVLEVLPVNDKPEFAFIPDANVIEIDEDLPGYYNQVIDISTLTFGPENEGQELSFNVETDDDNYFASNVDFPSISTTTGRLYFKIGDDLNTGFEDDIITLTISLSDGGDTINGGINQSPNEYIYIKVRPINDPPSFTLDHNIILDEINITDHDTTFLSWITNITPGPADESDQLLWFIVQDDTISGNLNNKLLKKIPTIDNVLGDISFSLSPYYNGNSKYSIQLMDDGGTIEELGKDGTIEELGEDLSNLHQFNITVRQINNAPDSVYIFSDLDLYAKNEATFHQSMNDSIYFRLPYKDFAPEFQSNDDMRFSWLKNDYIDVDTYPDINEDLYNSYYRLELINPLDSTNIVLFDIFKDSLEYVNNLHFTPDSFYVDIDLSQLFPFYEGEYNYLDSTIFNNVTYIDTSGNTAYSWRVITQNYSLDYYNQDPSSISDFSSKDFLVDFILPEVKFSYLLNDIYLEYYDLYMETSEVTIDSTARLTVLYDSGSSELLFPDELWNNTYHIASTFIDTGRTVYSMQVRDSFENVGKTIDSVYYQIINSNTNSLFSWPGDIAIIDIGDHSVIAASNLLLFTEEIDNSLPRDDLMQITKNYHLSPYSLEFNRPIKLLFDLDIDFRPNTVSIMNNTETGWEVVPSIIDGNFIHSFVERGGIYAIFYSEDLFEIIPDKFELISIYPNPFNPITTIDLSIPEESNVRIDIYNILGKKIKTLIDGNLGIGFYSLDWAGVDDNNNKVSTGIYLVKVRYKDQLISSKVTLLK